MNMEQSSERWITNIIIFSLKIAWYMWEDRNGYLHHDKHLWKRECAEYKRHRAIGAALQELSKHVRFLQTFPTGSYKPFEADFRKVFIDIRTLRLKHDGKNVTDWRKVIEYIKPSVLLRLYKDFGSNAKGLETLKEILVVACEKDISVLIKLNQALIGFNKKRAKTSGS